MSIVWWATFLLLATLGHCSDFEPDANGTTGQQAPVNEFQQGAEFVPDYVQKLYKEFSGIPDGSDVKDLSVYAVKPHKAKVLSHDKVRYEFEGTEKIFQESVNQVEFVLNVNLNESNVPGPLALRVCIHRVFCGPSSNPVPVDGFLSADLTELAESFLSHPDNIEHTTDLVRSLSVTVKYTGHHLQVKNKQPLLVIHSVAKSNYLHLIQQKQDENQQDESIEVGLQDIESREKRSTEFYEGPCKKHQWFLAFADAGMSGRTIQPDRFEANVCVGKCFGPDVQNQVKMSRHAYFRQNYYTSNGGNPPVLGSGSAKIQVPQACCVPTKYSATSTLFKDNENTISLRRISDAIVSECGCI